MLSAGLKNKEIGTRLNLSEKSIKRYVTCIFEKLNVRNRVEAAMVSRPEVQTGRRTQHLAQLSNPHPDGSPGLSPAVIGLAPPSAKLLRRIAKGGLAHLDPEEAFRGLTRLDALCAGRQPGGSCAHHPFDGALFCSGFWAH